MKLNEDEIVSWRTFVLQRIAAQDGGATDPIILKHHFTNIFRELDPGTKFFRDWASNRPLEPVELVWASLIYRWLNRRSTYERNGIPGMSADALNEWIARCRADRATGMTLGSAYHCTYFNRLPTWGDLALQQLPSLYEDELRYAHNGVQFVRSLKKLRGVGAFFAGQVVADYACDPRAHLSCATLVPLGTGSYFAIHLMRTGEFSDNSQSGAQSRVRAMRFTEDDERDLKTVYGNRPQSQMTFIDVEHSLCEWYRWRCIQEGQFTRAFLRRTRS